MLGVGLGLKIGGIGLVTVAGHREGLFIVVVLQVGDADGTQRAIAPQTTFGQTGERVGLVRCHIHNLAYLTSSPSTFPHIAVDAHGVVVLVHVFVALVADDALVGVVLIPRIDIPTLDTSNHTAVVIVFPFKTGVLKQVIHHFAVLLLPVALRSQVGHTKRVDADAITIDDDTLVGSHSISVSVILTIGVVEGTTIGGIAQALVAGERASTVVETDACSIDVSLETNTISSGGKRIEVLRSIIYLHTSLHGIAVLSRSKTFEGLGLVGASSINLVGGDVLLFQV